MRDLYEPYSDEELIVRLRDGEEQITDYIMDKYKDRKSSCRERVLPRV